MHSARSPAGTRICTGTSVRVGGGDNASANQTAALHAEMTWSVAAFDEEGTLIALSDSASVAP